MNGARSWMLYGADFALTIPNTARIDTTPAGAPSASGSEFVVRPGSLLIGGLGCLRQDLRTDAGVPVTRPRSAVSGRYPVRHYPALRR